MGDRPAAVQFYNQGVEVANNRPYAESLTTAYQLFVSACYADPTYGQANYQAGNIASDLNHLHASVACYRRALECEHTQEDKAKVLCNLGWRLHTIGQTQEAYEVSRQAVELDPHLAYAWLNLSLIHGMLEQPAQGAKCARKAFELSPDDPVVEMALAFALLFNREFVEGFKHFEIRFKYKLKAFLHYPYPRWEGQDDSTIFLVADQGLGDTLSFARFVEPACKKARYIHACVQPELMRTFQEAFAHIPNLNLIPSPSPFPQADYWTTFVSLPFALGLTDAKIRNAPEIKVPRYSLPTSWKVPDRKLHVGIAWRGSELNDINAHRSIPITQFLDLYNVPGIQLYSLQVDASKQQLHDQGCAAVIRDLSGYIRDVTDTVSLLQQLDLVITCESALGHICAAAGKECWIPYSYLGRDYRIGLDGSDRLWTPKHRIFRQANDQDWKPVFGAIVDALRDRA